VKIWMLFKMFSDQLIHMIRNVVPWFSTSSQ
jgi:hypothetical protein